MPKKLLPLLASLAPLLPAQTWTETNDAGQLPIAAQAPVGSGPLASIQGALSGTDADLFLIQIDNPAAFSASTVGGASFDTQLFLFDENGRGLAFNDDWAGTFQSRVTGQFVPVPGRYLLAIAEYDRDPIAASGYLWQDQPYGIERRPDAERRTEALSSWDAGPGGGSAYTIALTGASFPGAQIVLPDNHHLSESPVQMTDYGSSLWWRTGGGRFQILYHGSHLQSAGSSGPVLIDTLMFRGEDGETNSGGQSWNGVTVQLGATSLTALGSSFTNNRSAATTTLGTAGTTAVTVLPSVGSIPNNYNIVIDLAAIGAAFTLHVSPASTRPNLLIDITLPTAAVVPPGTQMIDMQDTTGTAAWVRGNGVFASSTSQGFGVVLGTPLVVGLGLAPSATPGAGGNARVVPARNEYYGAACGGQAGSFYQSFLPGQPFDLTGLTLTPNDPLAPATYTVTGGAPAVDRTKLATPNVGDDALSVHPLGFTFRFPGGATTTIGACTNGFVWLAGTGSTSPNVAVNALMNNPARLLPCWYDLHCGRNAAINPLAGMHVMTDTTGGPGNQVCYVTWLDVGVFNSVPLPGQAVYTMQCVLYEATGVVEFRYEAMPTFVCNQNFGTIATPAIVGFAYGVHSALARDPQSRDLSIEVPFTTQVEGSWGNIGQTAITTPVASGPVYGGRLFAGQSVTWNAALLPPSSLIGVQLVDIAASRPGFQLPSITAPGCLLSTTPNATVWEVFVSPGSATFGTRALAIPPGFDGADIYAQYVVLGGLFGASDLITMTSNAIRHTVGRN